MNEDSYSDATGDFRFAHDKARLVRRQRKYLRYFQQGAAQPEAARPILDLGCGRGYFLELLEQAGLPGLGLDASAAALAEYRGSLPTEQAEALEFLEDTKKVFAGIFCSHLIEHLPPPAANRLLDAMHNSLAAGGRLVLITPNPVNLHVLSETFHLDQTHVRPYPLKLLERLLRERNFTIVDQGWDADTLPEYPRHKWPLHLLRRLIIGRGYYTGEDSFIVAEKN